MSRPDADVTWLLDGDIIEPSSKFEFVVKDKERHLVVKDVTLDDEGEYSCVIGDNKTSSYVIVHGNCRQTSGS